MWDSSVTIVNVKLQTEARDFSFLWSVQVWDTFSLLFTGQWGLFPRDIMARA
jgi:hypothetical protein